MFLQISQAGPCAEGDIFMNTNKKNNISPDVHPVLHNQGCKMWTFILSFDHSARFLSFLTGSSMMHIDIASYCPPTYLIFNSRNKKLTADIP
jgi:hypothetical protein